MYVSKLNPVFSICSVSNFLFKLTPYRLYPNCNLDTLRWVSCKKVFIGLRPKSRKRRNLGQTLATDYRPEETTVVG